MASPDTIVPDPANPQSFNRYSYSYNNTVNFTDPSGHDPAPLCKSAPESCAPPPIIFYLNGLGFVGQITNPSPEAANSYIYTVYRLQEAVGAENVHHIPVYGQFRPIKSRVDMLNEALGLYKPQTKKAVQQIVETVGENRENLYSDQKLILVGSSAGGTIAIEALDELEKRGIFVDQIILRGSFVREYRLNNVGQIDYMAPDSPEDALWWNPWWSDKWNYSRDVNPFDSVSVQQHIVDGFTYHSPADIPDTSQRRLVREQIGNLIVDLLDW